MTSLYVLIAILTGFVAARFFSRLAEEDKITAGGIQLSQDVVAEGIIEFMEGRNIYVYRNYRRHNGKRTAAIVAVHGDITESFIDNFEEWAERENVLLFLDRDLD